MFLLVSVLLAFVMNAFGDGDWKLVSVTDNPVSVSDNGPKLASLQGGDLGDGLPLKLPIGSRKAIRDYIVAPTNMQMNIVVGLAIYGSRTFELTTSLYAYNGYRSYEEMLAVAKLAMVQAVAIFKTNSIPSETTVYSVLRVTYFNSEVGNSKFPIALSMENPASTFSTLTVEKAMDVIGPDDPARIEQVVVPIPKLAKVEVLAEIEEGVQATMTWTPESGPQLSSTWKAKDSTRESTIAGYLYLKNWLIDGSIRSRVSLTTSSGKVVTYTQFGVRITPPDFAIRNGEIDLTVSNGSDTDIFSSPDLVNWTRIQSIRSFHAGSDRPTATFTVPMNQSHLFFRGASY